MDPVNFGFADPSTAILNGIKMGAITTQLQQEAQQRQIAQQQALQQQADLRALAMNPNAGHADYARVMTQYPGLAEHLGKAFGVLEKGQQQNLLDFQSRVYAAQLSGNPELATQLLRDRAKADPQEAQHYETLANLIEKSPATARTVTALGLAGAMGPDKFAEAFAKIGGEQRAQELQPSALKKSEADASAAESDATIKAEQAKVAPQTVLLDLQKKGWDITKIQADIASDKEKNRLKAMEVAVSRTTNDLKRQELQLKIQETQQKMTDAIREKAATVETARSTIDNAVNTIDRILGNKSLNSVLGSLEGKDYYPNTLIGSLNPFGNGDERADAIALIETLKSQTFLSQIPNIKGTGNLSEKEGDKLERSLQNLGRNQSEEQFRANMKETQRLMLKARKNLVTRYGVPENVPDTPAAAAAAGPEKIDALVQKYLNPPAGRKN